MRTRSILLIVISILLYGCKQRYSEDQFSQLDLGMNVILRVQQRYENDYYKTGLVSAIITVRYGAEGFLDVEISPKPQKWFNDHHIAVGKPLVLHENGTNQSLKPSP
jgi:hypothetical protein